MVLHKNGRAKNKLRRSTAKESERTPLTNLTKDRSGIPGSVILWLINFKRFCQLLAVTDGLEWPWLFCGTVFVCPQSPCSDNDMIFCTFPAVLWIWALSEVITICIILVHNRSIKRLLHYLLHCPDETRQGRNSSPLLQFLAVSLDSIMALPR